MFRLPSLRRVFLAGVLTLSAIFLAPQAMASVNTSPVVQLVSYSDQYGIHVNMLGWGSASIINDEGVILSNNHVVDIGNGTLASAFSVCITKANAPRPVCDYTASLIERNSDMDIALLKIDPVDVHGKTVNYKDFATLPPDFTYSPSPQDNVLITGYPWVGADTITETRGIVSGTTEYNGFQYIKTDALIAGGNSGGAMISDAGKLVGIPTFTIGGFTDSSLGYGLSIKEAESFIQENIDRLPEDRSLSIDFPAYQGFLDGINNTGTIKDDLLTFAFPSDYKVSNYIKNRALLLEPKSQREIALMQLGLSLIQTPELTTEKAYIQHLEEEGYYSPMYEQLSKKTVGGITMLQPIEKGDVTEGQANYITRYFAQISPRLSMQISIVAPLYDEKNNARVQEEMTRVLENLRISPDTELLEQSFQFDLKRPRIRIAATEESYMDEFNGTFTQPLATKDAVARVSVLQKNLYNGKGKTVEEIIASETLNVREEYVQRLSFQGSEGYISCQGVSSDLLPEASYNESIFNFMPYFGMNARYEQRECVIRLLSGIEDNIGGEYTLKIQVSAPTHSITEAVDEAFTFLEGQVETFTEGKSVLINPYIEIEPLAFTDLEDQTPEYLELIRRLVRYDILDNTELFNPYRPTKWKELIALYTRVVYNVQPEDIGCRKGNLDCYMSRARIMTPNGIKTLPDILQKLDVNLEAYAPSNQNLLGNFDLLFRAILADTKIGNNSETDLEAYRVFPQAARFVQADRALNELEMFLSEDRKITMSDLSLWTTFSPKKDIVYSPSKGLSTFAWMSDKPVRFGYPDASTLGQSTIDLYEENKARYGKALEELKACSANIMKIPSCTQTYTAQLAEFINEDNEALLSYSVLTRAFAYDFVVSLMDFSKFDTSLSSAQNME